MITAMLTHWNFCLLLLCHSYFAKSKLQWSDETSINSHKHIYSPTSTFTHILYLPPFHCYCVHSLLVNRPYPSSLHNPSSFLLQHPSSWTIPTSIQTWWFHMPSSNCPSLLYASTYLSSLRFLPIISPKLFFQEYQSPFNTCLTWPISNFLPSSLLSPAWYTPSHDHAVSLLTFHSLQGERSPSPPRGNHRERWLPESGAAATKREPAGPTRPHDSHTARPRRCCATRATHSRCSSFKGLNASATTPLLQGVPCITVDPFGAGVSGHNILQSISSFSLELSPECPGKRKSCLNWPCNGGWRPQPGPREPEAELPCPALAARRGLRQGRLEGRWPRPLALPSHLHPSPSPPPWAALPREAGLQDLPCCVGQHLPRTGLLNPQPRSSCLFPKQQKYLELAVRVSQAENPPSACHQWPLTTCRKCRRRKPEAAAKEGGTAAVGGCRLRAHLGLGPPHKEELEQTAPCASLGPATGFSPLSLLLWEAVPWWWLPKLRGTMGSSSVSRAPTFKLPVCLSRHCSLPSSTPWGPRGNPFTHSHYPNFKTR